MRKKSGTHLIESARTLPLVLEVLEEFSAQLSLPGNGAFQPGVEYPFLERPEGLDALAGRDERILQRQRWEMEACSGGAGGRRA